VPFGPHQVTRLIVGGNPFSGHSHTSPELNREMIEYYSVANIKAALFEAERAGLNTMQSRADRHIGRMIVEYRQEGGRLQWIAQTASEVADVSANVRYAASLGAIGIYHHGSRTDALWRQGRLDEVRDLLKVVRDLGLQVGLGTHRPEVVAHAEERGWDVDFYMTSLYDPHPAAHPAAVVAGVAGGEVFADEDRERMLRTIRETPKTCLAFKLLAAGRNSRTPDDLRQAFECVLAGIKPTDALVVGVFQKRGNQIAENAAIASDILSRGSS
jgi:hypothetical protein